MAFFAARLVSWSRLLTNSSILCCKTSAFVSGSLLLPIWYLSSISSLYNTLPSVDAFAPRRAGGVATEIVSWLFGESETHRTYSGIARGSVTMQASETTQKAKEPVSKESVSVSLENISVSVEPVSVSVEELVVSIENDSVSTDKLSISIENASVSTDKLPVSIENVSVSIDNLAVSAEKLLLPVGAVKKSRHTNSDRR